jgi:Na+/proline symporter
MPLLLSEWAATGTLPLLAAIVILVGALAAIMSTADSVLLSLGSLVAEDLLGRSRREEGTTALGKRIAAAVMLAMATLALLAREVTLWGLIELKMELLIQCSPAFLVALHWRGLRAAPAAAGLAVGTAVAISGLFVGASRVAGIHLGVIGLVVNLLVAVTGSWWQGGPAGRGAHGSSSPAPR